MKGSDFPMADTTSYGEDLLKQLLNSKNNPPVSVVPDNALKQTSSSGGGITMLPQYGREADLSTAWAKPLSTVLDMLSKWRAQNPVYMPFAPGTPTLAAKELAEQMRQFNESLKYNYAKLAEEKRQFDEGLKYDYKKLESSYKKLESSSSSDSVLGKTARERERIATAQATEAALKRYKQGVARSPKGKAHGYPLEDTLLYIFTDPSMRALGTAGGADLTGVADYVVASVTGKSFDEYVKDLESQLTSEKRELQRQLNSWLGTKNKENVQYQIKLIDDHLARVRKIKALYNSMKKKTSSSNTPVM